MRSPEPSSEGHGGADNDRDRLLRAARTAFALELRRRRVAAGYSQASLAARVGYHTSYVSKMEGGRFNPTHGFARRADDVLRAGGEILHRYRAFHDLEAQERTDEAGRRHAEAAPVVTSAGGADRLAVLSEDAHLSYDGGTYIVRVRREIENLGTTAINGYPIRVHVDRYPEDTQRSREFYRANPLAWEELDFRCWYGDEVVELVCEPEQTSTDQLIEGWILFQGKRFGETFPLYPGQRMSFTYGYTVGADKWGRWFQRHVRFRTSKLTVRLEFPAELNAYVWGKENTLGQPRLGPIGAQIRQLQERGRVFWTWATADPRPGDRYRFEWRFDNEQPRPEET